MPNDRIGDAAVFEHVLSPTLGTDRDALKLGNVFHDHHVPTVTSARGAVQDHVPHISGGSPF